MHRQMGAPQKTRREGTEKTWILTNKNGVFLKK